MIKGRGVAGLPSTESQEGVGRSILTECTDGQLAVKGLPSVIPIGPHVCEHLEHMMVEVGLPKLFQKRLQESWQTCFWP